MTAKRLFVAVILSCLTLPGAGPAAAVDETAPPAAATRPACQAQAAQAGVPPELQLSTVCGDCVFDTPTACEMQPLGTPCQPGTAKVCRPVFPIKTCTDVNYDIIHCSCRL
jgi:hypothetical protein